MAQKNRLTDYSKNIYSQHGEDGILKKIFSLIEVKHKTCIEFGAWDALYLSTTAQFWKDQDWHAVLIEGDEVKYQEMLENSKDYQVLPIMAMVGYGPKDNLDFLLNKHKAPKKYDLLVIDVDGDDYYIWEAVTKIKPRVVVCEFNSTIPPHMDLKQQKGKRSGCGILPLTKLAEKKGYFLVALTRTNAIFVDTTHISKFKSYDTSLDSLFDPTWLNYVICNYDGYYRFTRSPIWGDKGSNTSQLVGGETYTPRNLPRRLIHSILTKIFHFRKKHLLLKEDQ